MMRYVAQKAGKVVRELSEEKKHIKDLQAFISRASGGLNHLDKLHHRQQLSPGSVSQGTIGAGVCILFDCEALDDFAEWDIWVAEHPIPAGKGESE